MGVTTRHTRRILAAYIFFRDQLGDAYCATQGDGRIVLRLRSRDFRLWLRHLLWRDEKKAPGSDALVENALAHLEGESLFHRGEEINLEVRVAWHEQALWYDLGGAAVRIDQEGWKREEEPPILFRRFRIQKPQVNPESGTKLVVCLPNGFTIRQRSTWPPGLPPLPMGED